MTDIAGTVPVIAVDKVQAVALAVCTYYFGVWLRGKGRRAFTLFHPSPVVGRHVLCHRRLPFLEYFNIVKGSDRLDAADRAHARLLRPSA